MEKLTESLKNGTLELPVLPEVATQVVSLTNDINCDSRQLAGLINRDQAMAGNVMRMVNSVFYSPPIPIVSLPQAVSRMGMKKIREIALVISCKSKVFVVPGHEQEVRDQFKHSLAAAAYAQEIARSRRWNVEEAFLCGLLHDVGRPVLLQVLVDLHKSLGCEFDKEAVEQAITKLHCYVGSELVKGWNLPARLSETIHCHHEPEKAKTAAQTTMMTNLADDMAHFILNQRPVTEAQLRAHPMLPQLNMYPDEFEGLLAKKSMVLNMVKSVA